MKALVGEIVLAGSTFCVFLTAKIGCHGEAPFTHVLPLIGGHSLGLLPSGSVRKVACYLLVTVMAGVTGKALKY